MPLLARHPDTPPGAVQSIEAELERIAGGAIATFRVSGDIGKLVIPPPAPPRHTDCLWKTTCFEVFVGCDGPAYREYNLSPSGQWAVYRFDDYRSGMTNTPAEIAIELFHQNKGLMLVAKISDEFPNPTRAGLTAVIEEGDGAIRYWSTAFAPGKPDFHAAAVRSLLFDGVSAE